jgi:hypothetical protein
MTRSIQSSVLAACVAAVSLAGCSSFGAPKPAAHAPSSANFRHGLSASVGTNFGRLDIPKHVLTWDWYRHAGMVDPVIAAPYLDFAAVQHDDANAFAAAGIKTVLYTDPNRAYVGTPMYTQDESTFAHDCDGNRITVGHRTHKTYQMDPRSPDLEPLWAAWVASVLGGGYNYTFIFEDGANNIHNTSAVPCGYTEPSWTAASNANDLLLGQNIIYNGLGTLGDGVDKPPPSILLNPTTWGGHLEGCYANVSLTNPYPKTVVWFNFETTELTMSNLQKPMVCRGLKNTPGEQSIPQRLYQYGSFLLTYNPETSIISEKFFSPSHLSVFPEETLVALEPVIISPTKVNKLKTAHWTFGRQYAACYLAGQLVGSCATVVNADNANKPHPFPWPGVYSHTLVLSGSGIIDGGTASVTGPPPPDTIPGASAIIAIQ